MSVLTNIWDSTSSPRFLAWWDSRRVKLMSLAIFVMVVASVVWLGYESWRLLFQTSRWGAIDMNIFHGLVHDWFAGKPEYQNVMATYPPASYVLLWPLLGWIPAEPARWLWGVLTAASLFWFTRLALRETGADTRVEKAFVVMMLLAAYPVGATIGNGQMGVLLLPPLLAGLLMLARCRPSWRCDLISAGLILVALEKPSISAPFMWMVLFLPGRLRPFGLVAAAYAALTVFAATFQQAPLPTLIRDWLALGFGVPGQVNPDLHFWLEMLGLSAWKAPATGLVFLVLGVFVYRFRNADPWMLLSVTALVARFWTYHGWYDDVIMLLPMIALFRAAKLGPVGDPGTAAAGVLLAINVLFMLAPGGLYLFPPPLNAIYMAGQWVVWVGTMVFLISRRGPAVGQKFTPATVG